MAFGWKEIVQNYIIKYADKIQETTKPLRNQLDVGYFTYHRIDLQGKYTVLVDRPDWAEHYVETKFYLNDPYLRHPDVYRTGLCSMQSHGSTAYKKKIIYDGKEIFNLDYNVMLIEKREQSVEFFGFAANHGTSRLEEIVLNCPSFLKTFAIHFKQKLAPILIQMQEETSSLIDLKGSDFFTKNPIYPIPKIVGFLEDCGKKSLVEQARNLSSQEKKCLHEIGMGRTAKEIALSLHLSSRTVESYIENIKSKLGLFSKTQLSSIARELTNFSLIP